MNAEASTTEKAPFVSGSLARHVLVMASTGAVGMTAVFLVDLTDLFFLSLLKNTAVTAAIGYAGTLVLLNIGVAIGSSIAAAVLVARNVGAGDLDRARKLASCSLAFGLGLAAMLTVVIVLGADAFLSLLGAQGEAKRLALVFLWTLSPGYVLAAGELCCAGILRGLGDARRAMSLTLVAAVVTLCLDPLLILVLGMGIQGAAIATTLGFLASSSLGFRYLVKAHRCLVPVGTADLRESFRPFWAIAYPAILSQLTMPFANSYLMYLMAGFGNEAVAGFAIVCRLIPVAYAIIFALQGAVGLIIGQNAGAREHSRIRKTLDISLVLSSFYALCVSSVLFLFSAEIATLFNAVGRTGEIVVFFCNFIAISWAFVGAQFLANAAFNNLGHPRLSLAFSWGRASLGTIPFAFVGARIGGAEGLLAGNAAGAILFGIAALVTAYVIVGRSASTKGP